jgi:hypothetical protein
LHERILTQREKQEIDNYLKSRQGSAFVYTLRHRARKFLPTIKEEIEILEKFLE